MLPSSQKTHAIAIYRSPFELGTPKVVKFKEGWSVLDMAAEMDFLPDNFLDEGIVVADGKVIPTDEWDKFIPATVFVKNVTFHAPIQGGGGGGSKKIVGLVAAIGLTVATSGIASGSLLSSVSGSIATSFGISAAAGNAILSGAVSLIGSLVISALTAPPVNRNSRPDTSGDASGSTTLQKASLSGNTLEPNASISRVIGTRRVFPAFAYEPVTEIIGQDEFVSAAYVLAGPHLLEDIQIGGATVDITDLTTDVSIQTFDGRPESTPIEIPNFQGRTVPLNFEMSKHETNPDNGAYFQVDGSLPVYHGVQSATNPDELWIHLMLQGLISQSSPTSNLRIPFRIRMKKLGDANWRYLPEIHYMENTQSQKRLQIKFVFRPNPAGRTSPRADKGWVEARKSVPAQNQAPVGTVFDCDSYFSAGSGDDHYNVFNVTTSNVINITLEPDVATFYLDPASWDPGAYQIEIKRGATFFDSSYASSTYTYGGLVRDFFGFIGSYLLPVNNDGLIDRMMLTRFVSVRFQYPIRQENIAIIYVRARNRNVDKLSVLASGYVNNWNGTSFSTYETTSNPAAHYLDVITSSLNADPIPDELIDFDKLSEWWERCDTEGLTCDMVVESGTVYDVLSNLASCGFARPYHSELWGVVQDYDRSAETPVQIFTSRNSSGITWKKALPRLPSALRVNFSDIEYDYDAKQVTVYRDGQDGNDSRIEQTTYEGITSLSKAIQRAKFDLRQGMYRSAIYSLSASAEAIKCRKGSLVGVNHDLVTKMRGAARVSEVILNSGGLISGLVLDQTVNIKSEQLFADVVDYRNAIVTDIGLRTGCIIRRTNGTFTTHEISNATGETDTIYFTTPFADDTTDGSFFDKGKIRQIGEGCLVAVGELNKVEKRYIVTEIDNGAGLSANLTLVDEAPQLWSLI